MLDGLAKPQHMVGNLIYPEWVQGRLGFQPYAAALQDHLTSLRSSIFFFNVRAEGGPHPRQCARPSDDKLEPKEYVQGRKTSPTTSPSRSTQPPKDQDQQVDQEPEKEAKCSRRSKSMSHSLPKMRSRPVPSKAQSGPGGEDESKGQGKHSQGQSYHATHGLGCPELPRRWGGIPKL